jgi:hypothetical protein
VLGILDIHSSRLVMPKAVYVQVIPKAVYVRIGDVHACGSSCRREYVPMHRKYVDRMQESFTARTMVVVFS